MQYDAWHGPNNLNGMNCFPTVLNDNTWYTFDVFFKAGAVKWIVRRNGVQTTTIPSGQVGFSSGSMVNCGAEGGGPLG
jgi:hypothetical protein